MKYNKNIIKVIIKNKFAVDSIWNLGSIVIIALSGILLNVVIGNIYKASGLGIFNQALAIYGILAIIAVFGINSSVLKYSAQYNNKKNELEKILTSSSLLSLTLGIIITTISLTVISILPYFHNKIDLYNTLKTIIIGLPLFSLNKVLLGFLNGLRKMISYGNFQSIRWILIFLFIIFFGFNKYPIQYTALSFPLTELILTILIYFFELKKYRPNFDNIFIWIKKHINFGSKSVFVNSISETNDKTDIFIISLLLNSTQVGIYSFASTLVKGILMLAGVIQLNFNPIISNLWSNNKKQKLTKYIQKIKKTSILLLIPTILIASLTYPFITIFLMKDPLFKQSIIPFFVLLIGVSILSLKYWASSFIMMAGYPEIQVKITLTAFITNIFLNLLLIKCFGIIGAAIANTLYYIILIQLIKYYSYKKLHFKLF